jgi:hypothetical protein
MYSASGLAKYWTAIVPAGSRSANLARSLGSTVCWSTNWDLYWG